MFTGTVRVAFLWSVYFFFFSSRRRHTRSDRDWSSDVCSSDLGNPAAARGAEGAGAQPPGVGARGGEDGRVGVTGRAGSDSTSNPVRSAKRTRDRKSVV